MGAERHRVPFVPPLTPWRARLIAGPGPGTGYVPGGSARGSRTASGSWQRDSPHGARARPGYCRARSAGAEPEEEPRKKPLCLPNSAESSGPSKTDHHRKAGQPKSRA
ncbi:unnamed protein product [Rangifer tarandus platyrhynchus]|uniref:Uncharacterized protein n=2 Tax=Rangifer tarandus platyrhynchus TaxID=3082113 RepID=A0ACB0ES58_RANTA|nr:unnamed protein product [Rangifer tarandus platyrhynchus]CAI9703520.1 unnamed protein product [Rangifer tarandus platyrhynchus]